MSKYEHNNLPLGRIKYLLEFLLKELKKTRDKEVFTFELNELSDFNSLLSDTYLLEQAFKDIQNHTDSLIEFRKFGPPIKTITSGDHYSIHVWFHAKDINKLTDYLHEIDDQIEENQNTQIFILESNGLFYPEGSKNLCHEFDLSIARYKLLHHLASKKDYVATGKLANEYTNGDKIKIRKIVGEIRDIVHKKMDISRKAIFENDTEQGYRITNVKLIETE